MLVDWKRNPACPECREGKKFFNPGGRTYDPERYHTPDRELSFHPECWPSQKTRPFSMW